MTNRSAGIPLTTQTAAVQLALEDLRESGARKTDVPGHRDALAAAVETLAQGARLDRLVAEIVDQRLADLTVERLIQTPRGYAETALAMLGDGTCLADPYEVALQVAEAAISHVLRDLTGGALPQSSEESPIPPSGRFVPLVKLPGRGSLIQIVETFSDKLPERSVYRVEAITEQGAVEAVNIGTGERRTFEQAQLVEQGASVLFAFEGDDGAQVDADLVTVEEACRRLEERFLKGEISFDEARLEARTRLSYKVPSGRPTAGTVFQMSAVTAVVDHMLAVALRHEGKLCGFCSRLRELNVERACAECEKLVRDELGADDEQGASESETAS